MKMNEGFVDSLRKGMGQKGPNTFSAADKSDGITSNYFGYVGIDTNRVRRYKDYDEMDEGIIATALDLIVDDATQFQRERGSAIWVKSSRNEEIREELEDLLYNVINIDEVIGDWGRQAAKYGDFFVRVYGKEGKGITRIDDSYHPSEVERIDIEGELEGFIELNEQGKPQQCKPWDFVHLKIQGSTMRNSVNTLDLRGMHQGRKRERVSTKYGTSVLQNAIAPSKKLQMVEDSLVLSRLARSPLRRLYFINVGSADVKEASKTISHFKNILKKRQSISRDGSFRSENHPFVSEEDVFIPVSDVKNEINVQEFGGDVDVRSIADVDFLKNKLFASIKVPQAFLGFEESLNGRNTLRQLDARYARTVKKVQTAILQAIIRICQIHLAYRDIDPDTDNFDLEMSYVSTIEEMERQEALEMAARSVSSVMDVITGLDAEGEVIDKKGLIYHLLKDNLFYDDDTIKRIAPGILPKTQAEKKDANTPRLGEIDGSDQPESEKGTKGKRIPGYRSLRG